jgi:hypothetical protein
MEQGHPLTEIVCQITNRVKLDIARLPGRIEVSNLRNRTAANKAEAKEAGVFLYGHVSEKPAVAVLNGNDMAKAQ